MQDDSHSGKNRIIDNFLVFLEKTGNHGAKPLILHRCGNEIGEATRKATMGLLASIERDMFSSQSSDPAYKGIDGLLKSLGYLSK